MCTVMHKLHVCKGAEPSHIFSHGMHSSPFCVCAQVRRAAHGLVLCEQLPFALHSD